MTRKKKILVTAASLLTLAIASLGIAMSYDSSCQPAPAVAANVLRMQAIVHGCYGGGESLKLEQVARPVPREDEVLVRVHASSVNPADWHMTTGKPYVMRLGIGLGAPKVNSAGIDFAGVVEAVGAKVTKFAPGDAVFGGANGAFAEYLTTSESHSIARKPAELSFEEAAAIPIAGITALKALRDHAKLRRGQKILINGASGGVGTFAVQIAKAYGAEVTAVCSTKNVDLVRALGADVVVDYTREDFTTHTARYHVILDNVGNRSFREMRKALEPRGIVVLVGGPKGAWIEPFFPIIQGKLVEPFVDERFEFFVSDIKTAELEVLADLVREGKLRPAIGSHYPLREVPAAMDYLGGRHARGKVVIRID